MGRIREWQSWAPYAAVAWSVVYAALGAYWAVTGSGFPYAPGPGSDVMGPVAGRFGPGVAWAVVVAAGFQPRPWERRCCAGCACSRPLFIAAGGLIAGALLLLMTDVSLLILLGYTPYGVVGLLTGAEIGQLYLKALIQWTILHQLLCLIGGFLWLAATVSYARRSGDACLSCGRRDGPEGWTSPDSAARWGRIAVYVAMVVPVFYALTRYAYGAGHSAGDQRGVPAPRAGARMWTAGPSWRPSAWSGAVLTLGLVQHWGEMFPRWMIGLAGRRVPIALAVVPASIVSVLIDGRRHRDVVRPGPDGRTVCGRWGGETSGSSRLPRPRCSRSGA